MLVGAIYPPRLCVFTYDGKNHTYYSGDNEKQPIWGSNEYDAAIDFILKTNNLSFDALVILSYPSSDVPDLVKVAEKYASNVSVHAPIISAAHFFIHKLKTLIACINVKNFCVIFNGNGCDVLKFTEHDDKYLLCSADYYPSKKMKFKACVTLNLPIEHVFYANIKDMVCLKHYPATDDIPHSEFGSLDFIEHVFAGGVLKALAKIGQPISRDIYDCVTTLYLSLRKGTKVLVRAGTPFNATFKKEEFENSTGNAQIYIYQCIEVNCDMQLKRNNIVLFQEENVPPCLITIETHIAKNGVVEFSCKVPPSFTRQVNCFPTLSCNNVFVAPKPHVEHQNCLLINTFLSNEYIILNKNCEASVYEVIAVEPLKRDSKRLPTIDFVIEFYRKMFSNLPFPQDSLKYFLLHHDGTVPAPLITAVYRLAFEMLDQYRVHMNVVSSLTIVNFYNLSLLPVEIKTQTCAVFIIDNVFNVVYTRYSTAETKEYQICDEWQDTFSNFNDACNLINDILYSGQPISRLTVYAENEKPFEVYRQKLNNNLLFVRKWNYKRSMLKGLIGYASYELRSRPFQTTKKIDYSITDHTPPVYIQFNESPEEIFYPGDCKFQSEYVGSVEILETKRKFKLFMKLSLQYQKECVLYEAVKVPKNITQLSITIKFFPTVDMPQVTVIPTLEQVNYYAEID